MLRQSTSVVNNKVMIVVNHALVTINFAKLRCSCIEFRALWIENAKKHSKYDFQFSCQHVILKIILKIILPTIFSFAMNITKMSFPLNKIKTEKKLTYKQNNNIVIKLISLCLSLLSLSRSTWPIVENAAAQPVSPHGYAWAPLTKRRRGRLTCASLVSSSSSLSSSSSSSSLWFVMFALLLLSRFTTIDEDDDDDDDDDDDVDVSCDSSFGSIALACVVNGINHDADATLLSLLDARWQVDAAVGLSTEEQRSLAKRRNPERARCVAYDTRWRSATLFVGSKPAARAAVQMWQNCGDTRRTSDETTKTKTTKTTIFVKR